MSGFKKLKDVVRKDIGYGVIVRAWGPDGDGLYCCNKENTKTLRVTRCDSGYILASWNYKVVLKEDEQVELVHIINGPEC